VPATPSATSAFSSRLSRHPAHFRPALGLQLSSLGLGSYLGKDDEAADAGYAEAVRTALQCGVNVVDCAANYRHQRSERALGRGLKEAFAAGIAKREEVFFCTKAGYFPFDGKLPPDPHAWLFRTYVESGLCAPDEVAGGCHCMAPKYLAHQVARSLENTGLDALDVVYVHNPEQQLEDVSLDVFLRRWRLACEELERQGAAGRLQWFGAATWNGFRTPPERPGHLPLAAMLRIAEDVGGPGHRFRVLQFPCNMAMLEAAFAPTQPVGGERLPVAEAARRLGLACFASVPLLQGRILKGQPGDFAKVFAPLTTGAQRALQFVRSIPGIVAPLAGSKTAAHVKENAEVLGHGLPSEEVFRSLFRRNG
jgi:aryl-alcohol dehydrogenase-like predicted oxidoreductase